MTTNIQRQEQKDRLVKRLAELGAPTAANQWEVDRITRRVNLLSRRIKRNEGK